jgi:hypothetical protein
LSNNEAVFGRKTPFTFLIPLKSAHLVYISRKAYGPWCQKTLNAHSFSSLFRHFFIIFYRKKGKGIQVSFYKLPLFWRVFSESLLIFRTLFFLNLLLFRHFSHFLTFFLLFEDLLVFPISSIFAFLVIFLLFWCFPLISGFSLFLSFLLILGFHLILVFFSFFGDFL